MPYIKQMSREELEKSLRIGTVDAGNGTLFGVHTAREPRREGLTLVISTGGSGMSAIKAAIKTANQKLAPDYTNYVKFIVLDSDSGQIANAKKDGVDVINISSPGAQIRLEKSKRNPYYKGFVPDNYDITLLNEDGASQDRTTGKIKLYDQNSGKTNDAILRDKISALFQNEWKSLSNLPIDIMILTGISGGNGSGTFLDIAAIARKACPAVNGVRVYGYIMLPDTADRFADTDKAKNSHYRNGFAALKELESYMSMDFEEDRKELFPSQNSANDVEISKINKLYDYPVLISGDYDEAVSMIAETIVNSIAANTGGFSQRSFYSNLNAMRLTSMSKGSMLNGGILASGACPEDSHSYCGIGYAHASIPEKIVIPNVVSRINKKLYIKQEGIGVEKAASAAFCTEQSRLTRIEFEQQMRVLLNVDARARLDENTLLTKVNALLQDASRLPQNNVEITRQEIIMGKVADYLRGFGVDRTVNAAIPGLIDRLHKLYENFTDQAKLVMNIYGPRAIQYLYEGKGNDDENGVSEDYSDICLKRQLEVVTTAFARYANTPPKYPPRFEGSGVFIVEAWRNFTQKNVDEWIGRAQSAAKNDVYYQVSQRMTGVNGGWKKEFEDRIINFKDSCVRFANILEAMMNYYTSVGSSLDKDDYKDFANTTGDPNGVNLCSDSDVYRWVVRTIENKVNNVVVADAKQGIVSAFFDHTDDWVNGEDEKARQAFDDVMSRIGKIGKYATDEGGLHLTITDYFNEVLKDISPAQQTIKINNTVEDIMKRLLQASKPALKTNGKMGHINKVILVPDRLFSGPHGEDIRKAFGSYTDQGDTVAESTVVDAIVCYQASVANAISDLQDLSLWENGYQNAFSANAHLNNGEYFSLHMDTGYSQYRELSKSETDKQIRISPRFAKEPITENDEVIFGTGLAWRNYPSINIIRYQNDFSSSENTFEARYRRDVFDKKIEAALKLGIIECKQVEKNIYKYYLNILPSDWTNLDVRRYRQVKDGALARGESLFEYLAAQNRASRSKYRKQIMLYNSEAFGEDGFDFNEILGREMWTDEMVTETHRAYMKRIMRKATELYLDLEDTLYRYYEVECALRDQEGPIRELEYARNFWHFMANGLVNADKDKYEWTLLTDETRTGQIVEPIITFSRRTKANMSDLDKKYLQNGLDMAIVYKSYRMLLDSAGIDDKGLRDGFCKSHVNAFTDKEYDILIEERAAWIENAIAAYDRLCGGSKKDPVDSIMDNLNLDDDVLSEIELVVALYEAAKEYLPTLAL